MVNWTQPLHPTLRTNSKWRMGILCADCRLRPKNLPPYGDVKGRDGVDYCEGHNTYGDITKSVFDLPDTYSVMVMVTY